MTRSETRTHTQSRHRDRWAHSDIFPVCVRPTLVCVSVDDLFLASDTEAGPSENFNIHASTSSSQEKRLFAET